MTKIIDHLYLGDLQEARRGIKHGLYHCIINLSGEILGKQGHNNICIWNIPAIDDEQYRLDYFFDTCFDIINRCIRSNLNVLVNCYAGISRSSSIIIAFLIKKFHIKPSDALLFVKLKKPDIHPNNGFLKQLANYY